MVTPELLAYIKSELAKGKSRDEIHATLIQGGGWTQEDIQESFASIIPTTAPASSSQSVIPQAIHQNPIQGTFFASNGTSSIKSKMKSRVIFVGVIGLLVLLSSLFQGGANISGMMRGKGTLVWLFILTASFIVGFYFKYRREAVATGTIPGNVERANFFILFLKTLSYSWLIAPLFIDMGSMGGISVPVPGVFFLLPIFGQIAAFATFIVHPELLCGLWALFALYMTLMIILSRKITQKKVTRVFFVIAMIGLYWILAKAILPYLIQ